MVYTDCRLPTRGVSAKIADSMQKNKNKQIRSLGKRVLIAKEGRAQRLVKIGEVALEYGILPSTINFYTREGLLPEDARSIGGYRLYHKERTIDRLKRIDYLQNTKRLSIGEIKKVL